MAAKAFVPEELDDVHHLNLEIFAGHLILVILHHTSIV